MGGEEEKNSEALLVKGLAEKGNSKKREKRSFIFNFILFIINRVNI